MTADTYIRAMQLLQVDLTQETADLVNRVTVLIMLPFIVAFSFIVFIIYRRNREGALRKRQLELELKAIRAQMNPHFIFNCLNSIHYCIQQNQTEKAGNYLLKFSFLTRRILENSSKKLISLEEDLDLLKTYLELEQLRSGDRFTYEIILLDDTDPSNVSVPMLLLQPLVENAVWHGFDSRSSDGKIIVEIHSTFDEVIFRVSDNGIVPERYKKLEVPGKEKSMGRSLIASQLDALSELEGRSAKFNSEVIRNESGEHCGMITVIELPFIPIYS